MPLNKEQKTTIITDYKLHETDTGSSEVQIALLTKRITDLTEHFKTHFRPEIRNKESFVSSIANGVAPVKSSLETIPHRFQPGMNLRVSHVDNHLLAIAEPIVDQDAYAQLSPGEVAFRLKRVLI